ncbi:MAG: ribose-5-phosphate isomerase RpiA [Polyangiaceae bacterium]|nr:ribose-5-phosphate isomerase RpiA [Polyangiaceae bacterium]
MTVDAERAAAAEAAVNEVRAGMLVGLGTGRTAAFAVRALAQRVKEGLRATCVATSTATERLGVSLGLRVIPFEAVSRVDLTIDGADEIDPRFCAIKGGGGALLREKVVAAASDRVLIVVDANKVVERLGSFPLPVEVLPFAEAWVMRALTELGAAPTRRVVEAGTPFRTDQQNFVVDAAFGFIDDAADLAARLASIPGIVEHGLFVGEIDEVFVGREDGVERRTKMR